MNQTYIYAGLNSTRKKLELAILNGDLAEMQRLNLVTSRWLSKLSASLKAG